MKKLMIAVIGLIVSAQAHAGLPNSRILPKQPALVSNLTKFTLQQGSTLEQTGIVGGSLKIDQSNKNISLTLFGRNNCPPNAMCLVGPMTFQYEAKLLTIETNNCGSIVYHATSNLLPVDGILTDIIVTDNTTNTCKTFVALPATEVVLTTETLRQQSSDKSYMTGEKLQLLGLHTL